MAFEAILFWFLAVVIIANIGLYFSKKIGLPFVLTQLIIGIILAFVLKYTGIIDNFTLPTKLLFFGLLPPILFESSVKLPYRKIKKDWFLVILLSTFGVILTSLVFAGLLSWVTQLPFWLTFLIAGLLSSTDPIAVLSIFKQLGVAKRLVYIVDTESMINDATSIILSKFTLVITAASFGLSEFNVQKSLIDFGLIIFGSIFLGIISGVVFSRLIRANRNQAWMEISLSLLATYIPFLLAENYLGFSGIIVAVISGIIIGNLGIYSFSSSGEIMFKQNWDYLGFLANSAVFIFLGIDITYNLNLKIWYITILSYISLLIARFVVTGFLVLVSNKFAVFNLSKSVPYKWLVVLNLGGLRGALPIIAGLFITHLHPEAHQIINNYSEIFFGIIMGVVTLSLMVQGLSIQSIIKYFKLNQKEYIENASKIWQEVIATNIAYRTALNIEKHSHHKIRSNWSDVYLEELKQYINNFLNTSNNQKDILSILYIYTFEKEKEFYTNMYKKDMITYKVMKQLKKKIDASLDMIEKGVLPNTFHNLPVMVAISKEREKFCLKDNYVYRKAREYGNLEVISNLLELAKFPKLNIYIQPVLELYKYFQQKNLQLCKELESMHAQETCCFEEDLGKQEYVNYKKEYLSLVN